MRPTWIVLGVVVGLGAVAYVKLRSKADTAPLARPAGQPVDGKPAESPGSGAAPGAPNLPIQPVSSPGKDAGSTPTPPLAASSAGGSDAASVPENEARSLVANLNEKLAQNDAAGALPLEERLSKEYGETLEARRYGLSRGAIDAKVALDEKKPLETRVDAGLRARRSLSRALFLPELFDATTGRPTPARVALLQTIASVNAFVMTKDGGVKDVTRPYDVVAGDNPLRIVSRDKLTCGPNAILFWSQGGNLDPKRLKVGDRLLIPLETLSVHVSLERHLLGVYLGDALVKEFNVGVGKASTPTYPGVYEVKDKYLNPDWHSPNGVIPYGDPKNELGDAWIPISSTEKPKGYGIHGTNKPDTVGTDCSNGCVRLRNEEAVEMTSWVRTAKGEGQATRVYIK